jgi:hypothetical protein
MNQEALRKALLERSERARTLGAWLERQNRLGGLGGGAAALGYFGGN